MQNIEIDCFGGVSEGQFWGVKAAVGTGVGANIGFFTDMTKLCYLGSADFGSVGVGASITKLTIFSSQKDN